MFERYDIYVSVSQRITKGLLIMLEWQVALETVVMSLVLKSSKTEGLNSLN